MGEGETAIERTGGLQHHLDEAVADTVAWPAYLRSKPLAKYERRHLVMGAQLLRERLAEVEAAIAAKKP